MFICTVRASTLKFFTVLFLSAAALVALIAAIPEYDSTGDVAVVSVDYSGIRSEEDRIRFISSFGYTVERKSCVTESVTVPERFDSVYEEYNDIQRSQGLNLKKYRGKTVTKYTYYVTNYNDFNGKVMITVLVYNGDVIGGDVTGIDGEGFVHGFEKKL